jgi:ribonuclease Z
VSERELVVLGTASQVPTRARSHHAALLRWDGMAFLLDPGEGAQRQLLLAGVSPSSITGIALTHLHGDHCLGLPGVLQRLSLDGVARPVPLWFPASGLDAVLRLRRASAYDDRLDVRLRPVARDGALAHVLPGGAVARGPVGHGGVDGGPALRIVARRLDHPVEAFGYRFEEPDGRRLLPDRLAAVGLAGPAVGRLQRDGVVEVGGRRVAIEEVSEPRRGQVVAFVMDTRPCPGAEALAAGADLLVCEATFLERDAERAAAVGHCTAGDAARLARASGARRLVLTHFSQRYPDEREHLAEAAAIFPDVVAARDLDRIPVPRRRPGPDG